MNLETLMRRVREDPSEYLTNANLTELDAFLYGYMIAQSGNAGRRVEAKMFRFTQFVREQGNHPESTCGWMALIYEWYPANSWDAFWTLWDKFIQKYAEENKQHLTKAAKRHHLRTSGQDCCPFCKSELDNADYGDIGPVESGMLEQQAQCIECKRKWIDVFQLVDIREIV